MSQHLSTPHVISFAVAVFVDLWINICSKFVTRIILFLAVFYNIYLLNFIMIKYTIILKREREEFDWLKIIFITLSSRKFLFSNLFSLDNSSLQLNIIESENNHCNRVNIIINVFLSIFSVYMYFRALNLSLFFLINNND